MSVLLVTLGHLALGPALASGGSSVGPSPVFVSRTSLSSASEALRMCQLQLWSSEGRGRLVYPCLPSHAPDARVLLADSAASRAMGGDAALLRRSAVEEGLCPVDLWSACGAGRTAREAAATEAQARRISAVVECARGTSACQLDPEGAEALPAVLPGRIRVSADPSGAWELSLVDGTVIAELPWGDEGAVAWTPTACAGLALPGCGTPSDENVDLRRLARRAMGGCPEVALDSWRLLPERPPGGIGFARVTTDGGEGWQIRRSWGEGSLSGPEDPQALDLLPELEPCVGAAGGPRLTVAQLEEAAGGEVQTVSPRLRLGPPAGGGAGTPEAASPPVARAGLVAALGAVLLAVAGLLGVSWARRGRTAAAPPEPGGGEASTPPGAAASRELDEAVQALHWLIEQGGEKLGRAEAALDALQDLTARLAEAEAPAEGSKHES